VAHQCRAIEAVDSPMREAIEGNDVLRNGLAVKDDIKKKLHVGTNEVAPEKQSISAMIGFSKGGAEWSSLRTDHAWRRRCREARSWKR
jgi:hypothetical protein